MNRLITAAILFLALSSGQVFAHGMSLADALALAYKNSDQLKIARATLRQTDEGVAGARAATRPSVAGQAQVSETFTFNTGTSQTSSSVSVTASQLLYDGGRAVLGIEQARMDVLAQRENLINTEQSVLLNAATVFLNVVRDRDAVRLAENNVRVLREQVRAARDRFDVGEITRTDVSQTEARLAQSISVLERNRGTLRATEAAFKATIGVKPSHLHSPTKIPNLPGSASSAESLAVKNHPRITEAQFQVKSAELALEAANRNRSLTVTGSVTGSVAGGSSVQTKRDTASVGLNAQVPLYQGGQLRVARRSALAALERAKSNLQLQAVVTRQNVSQAYANWVSTRSAIQSNQQQIRAAQIAFEGVREEATLGARTTLDALNAEQELLSARSSLISAQRDERAAAYTVLSEMGLMTVDHLRLKVTRYDPDVNYTKVNGVNSKTENKLLGRKRLNLLEKLQNR